MKSRVVFLTILLLFTVAPFVFAQKKAKERTANEKIEISIIHNGQLPAAIHKTQRGIMESLAQNAGENEERFLGSLLFLGNAAYSMITGALVDAGQNALKNAIEKNRQKYSSEWVASVSKDFFYDKVSFNGAIDPSDMHFGGLKAVRLMPNRENPQQMDTVFTFVATISHPEEIVKTSRFTLKLDTLYIDLSRTRAVLPEGKTFNIEIQVKILSSWVNEAVQYFKDEEMGIFTISLKNIKYDPANPDCIKYAISDRTKGAGEDDSAIKKGYISGSSFVIPRSAYGTFNKEGKYITCYGQGEYSMVITVKEKTNRKTATRDFFNNYLIKVTDAYGKAVKESKIIETGIDISIPGESAGTTSKPTK